MKIVALLFLALACAAPVFASAAPPEVPEPGTFVMIGTGLAGAAIFAWRRNRNK